MTRFHTDPTLSELLGDPVTKAIMKADRVDPQKLEATLRSLAREIAGGSPRIGTGHEMTNFAKTVCLAAILVIAFACVTPNPKAAQLNNGVREGQAVVTELNANTSAITYWVSESKRLGPLCIKQRAGAIL
jgi:hypothetical protein